MGLIFSIIIQLIALVILCAAIGTVACLMVKLMAKKKTKRKLAIAFMSPFITLFTWFIISLFGQALICYSQNVDIGIGDTWYVPIDNNHRLLFIDELEIGNLEKGNQVVIGNISEIQEKGGIIYAMNDDSLYSSYNLETKSLQQFTSATEMKTTLSEIPKLAKTSDFYFDKRNQLVGFSTNVISILSLFIGIGLSIIFARVILLA